MKSHYLPILENKLVQMAKDRRWSIELEPAMLTAGSYRSVSLERGLGSVETDVSIAKPITDLSAIAFESCSVIIGSLGDDLFSWEDKLRLAHGQAAIARSWLTGGLEVDLYLFLIGPQGSARSNEWQDIARAIERDERICRKLVWLPAPESDGTDDYEQGLAEFCERTFFAEPWTAATVQTQQDLDPLGSIERDLGPRFTKETSLPASVLSKWLRILERNEDASKMAQELIATIQDET